METKTYKIDATGKPLGRLAVKVAVLLRGKNKADFAPHKEIGDFVIVKNFSKVKFSGDKFNQKKYYHHSGYPGGLKEEPLKKIFDKSPEKILRMAVLGMMPKNKLRAQQIKRLRVEL